MSAMSTASARVRSGSRRSRSNRTRLPYSSSPSMRNWKFTGGRPAASIAFNRQKTCPLSSAAPRANSLPSRTLGWNGGVVHSSSGSGGWTSRKAPVASDARAHRFSGMRTTAEYERFPAAPSGRALARARWLAREGRVTEAADAYRAVLASHPRLKPCWAEYFELLRRGGRAADALRVAEGAAAQFGESAFALTLKGAALTELGRYREALAVLDQAVESDPDLALVWHELGYAAYRLGDRNRALLALDRAFALEPHTETLRLRGRILRDAGRYQAAEVAFEGAAQAAEHGEQREEAEREIASTRRYV